MENVIEINKLTKYYGNILGIKELDLQVRGGEILGFIGPNGAGKSTTIRLLLSLIYPSGGSASIFGKDVVEFGSEIKKDIGYMPSEVFYYDNMRVKSLLEYSASFYGNKRSQERIKELAAILKLDLNKKIEDLSYGNKKKVGIVQGLLHNPKLIILDEPTGGLDPLIQKSFFEIIKQENQKGVTVFFSSHILSEVQRICDRVAIIKEGQLIEVDTIPTLMDNAYKRVRLGLKSKADKKLLEMPGVSDLDVSNSHITFMYKGDINKVSSKIAQMDLTDLVVEDPDLEEIFMHYYK